MLQLLANGQQLDTSGVKFNLTLKNPIFSRDKLEGSYIFNFNLPATISNKKIFDFQNRLEKHSTGWIEMDCLILFNGIVIVDNSTISVNNYSNGHFVANVKVGNGSFINKTKDVSLKSLDLGGMTFGSESAAVSYFNSTVNTFYPDVPFCLPQIEADTDTFLPSGTTGYHNKDVINFWDEPNSTYRNDINGDKGLLMPMLYMPFILKEVFKIYGYSTDDQLFTRNSDITRLLLFNLYNVNGGIPFVNEKPYYTSAITNILYSNHVPNVNITDFLLGLTNLLNTGFFINDREKKILIKNIDEILKEPDYIEFSSNVLKTYSKEDINKAGFSLKQTPDDTDAYQKYYIDVIKYYTDNFGGILDLVSDLPENPFKYIYYYVLEDNTYYHYYFDAWHVGAFPVQFHEMFKIPNSISIESIFSTLRYDGNFDNPMFGISAYDWNKISPRALLFRGLQNETGILNNYWPRAGQSFNNSDLRWHTENGLYHKNYKHTIDLFQDHSAIKYEKLMKPIEIRQFDFSKKHRISGINSLIKEVKIPFEEKRILPATLECYKI